MELLSSKGRLIPNYNCDIQKYPVAIIGGPDTDVCLHVAIILHIYKFPQLTYGSAPITNKDKQAGFYHQMFPNTDHQYKGILQLLQHFKWTWIGVVSATNENGEKFEQNVVPMFAKSGICFAFIERTPVISYSTDIVNMVKEGMETYTIIMNSTVNSVLVQGEIVVMIVMRMFPTVSKFEEIPLQENSKIIIMTAQMDFASLPFQRWEDLDFLHGALSFAVHSREILGFREFLQTIKPNFSQEDGFIRVFWKEAFGCMFSGSMVDGEPNSMMDSQPTCTGEEKLETLPASVSEMDMTGHSYSIYNAIYILAQALHVAHSDSFKHRARRGKVRFMELLKLHPWKARPLSLCNHYCQLGYAKSKIEGKPFCCYDCLRCPEGKISNVIGRLIPNYNCDIQKYPVAIIGGPDTDVCLHVAIILQIYKFPQLTYGSAPITNKDKQAGFYHQMFPNVDHQYKGILQLLQHFKWTWTGVLSANNENGEMFVQNMVPMFAQSGICFDFIERFPIITYSTDIVNMVKEGMKMYTVVINSTVNSVLVQVHSRESLGFREFLQTIKPNFNQEDGFIRVFWNEAFGCVFSGFMVDGKPNSMMDS
ncbi:vomeronasal type-2 receptor 26-like [Python bivittatus]|uniref:Vomeronasal type-2 receptor 26-like n=1 Tax=Python bivittatus TaxID=176946 RepID=A0A9F5J3E9_PYTBI|nr:vomeronasal type-2 receptor 26-like [Python bivittatus]